MLKQSSDITEISEVLKALSDPTRLKIAGILAGGALCVNAISARLDVTQGAVSQHLRIMRSAGLVTGEKRGPFVHYALRVETFEEAARMIKTLPRGTASCPPGSGPCEPSGGENKCPKK